MIITEWDENTLVPCGACGKEFKASDQYAHWSGKFYCSKACYSTLFETCNVCHQGNMTVPVNQRRYKEHVCDKCYNERHGLAVVGLGIGPFSKDYGGSG